MNHSNRKPTAGYTNEGHSRNIATFLTWYNDNTSTITNCLTQEKVMGMLLEKLKQAENEKDHGALLILMEQLKSHYKRTL